jgi:hypothetical protein
MSSFDVERNQELDYQENEENATQFYQVLTEYLILKDKHEEPTNAMNLRLQAEDVLKEDENNYSEALSFIATALKLFKAFNNIS